MLCLMKHKFLSSSENFSDSLSSQAAIIMTFLRFLYFNFFAKTFGESNQDSECCNQILLTIPNIGANTDERIIQFAGIYNSDLAGEIDEVFTNFTSQD
jgi:hypothetical protein